MVSAQRKLLHELGALVTVNDAKQFDQNPDAQDLLTLGIRVVTGASIELLDEEFELIVKITVFLIQIHLWQKH